DVATRVSTRKTKGPWAAGPPRFTADGRHVVFEADRREGADRTFHEADVYRVTLESPDGPERLTDAAGPQGNPLPSPDGRSIAAVGYPVDGKPPSHQDDGLWLLPNDGSALRQLTHGYDRAIGDGAGQDVAPPRGAGQRIRWAPDGKSLIATSARDGAVDLVRVGLDNSVTPLVTLDEGAIHGFDVATAPGGGERLVVLASFPTRPLELYTVDLPTTAVDSTVAAVEHPASWTRLTHTHDATDDRFVDYEELWIDSFDGQRVQGWLAKPASFDPAKRYPLVLYIHGGPHTMYGSVFFHEFQVLAHAGYAVLFTNPRGSTGYGTDFANIIQYRYPGDDYRDLMAFVDTVLERDWVDPERLGVAGGSGGGLLTTWTVGHTDRFAAAVAQRNVTNWHSFVGTSDFNHAFVEAWFPGYPWEVRDNYLERSPLYHVDKVTTPVLLIHSEQDYRTPLEQTLQYYVALKMRQLDAKLVIFPEEPHGLSRTGRPSHRIARLQHILDWFDRYLKP
ncbi:MAG: S9 family peptidase, partial [Acidobacteriota bacterium]